jgi:nitrogen regulatory protein PII-like uncharacterized protein
MQLFVETENIARKLGLLINQGKIKYMIVELKSTLKNIMGQLAIKDDTF